MMWEKCSTPLWQTAYVGFLYFVGLAGTCVGVALCLKSAMGIDAWNASIAGLSRITPLSLGTWTILVHLTFWIVSTLIDQKIRWGCIIPVLYKGIVLDIVKPLVDRINLPDGPISRFLCFIAGYLIISVFTGIYLSTEYPRMPVDGLMFALSNLAHTSIKLSRLLMEITGFITVIFVRGIFGVGTVIMTLTCGMMFSACKRLSEKLLLRNINKEKISGSV